ncbi:MAG: hypothetical protein R3E48_18240 [Burkholderiaceae bacterium]
MKPNYNRLLRYWVVVGAINSCGLAANATTLLKPVEKEFLAISSSPDKAGIRSKLENIRGAVRGFVKEEGERQFELAQWGNWGNWGNWNNWRDWLKPWYNFQNWGNF